MFSKYLDLKFLIQRINEWVASVRTHLQRTYSLCLGKKEKSLKSNDGCIILIHPHSDNTPHSRKEGNVLFNEYTQLILFTVIWRQTYGNVPHI